VSKSDHNQSRKPLKLVYWVCGLDSLTWALWATKKVKIFPRSSVGPYTPFSYLFSLFSLIWF
jgi:hypothetical protein